MCSVMILRRYVAEILSNRSENVDKAWDELGIEFTLKQAGNQKLARLEVATLARVASRVQQTRSEKTKSIRIVLKVLANPEPFEHKGKMYPGLEIFADVINILVVEPKALETESESKEEEKELKKEGVEGPQTTEEEKKEEEEKEEGQVAQVKEEESNKGKVNDDKEEEDPADQVLKAI
ncbi:hypothetical protein JCGZ_10823 [Jatropha curcas]|uniref:Uncharacterized protein n=1 Tax=Jatropha curcas TaxID=180498 RepID=A0A067KT34_JATCU|nr:hypothetical protein JCGZ_10823 [Jatropha curcas]